MSRRPITKRVSERSRSLDKAGICAEWRWLAGAKTYITGVQGVRKLNEVPSASGLVRLVLCDLLGAFIVQFDTNDGNGDRENRGVGIPDALWG
jgi:hypothetical protein